MGDRRRNVELGTVNLVGKRTLSKLPVKRRFQVSLRMSAPLHRQGMGDRRRNVELGAAKLVRERTMSKLPVKRRFQVSMRMSAPLQRQRMAVNVPASEEGGGPSDDVELSPHHCLLTALSSGSDTEVSDRDEETAASGYLADSEMEPRRHQIVSRIQSRLKSKAGIVHG